MGRTQKSCHTCTVIMKREVGVYLYVSVPISNFSCPQNVICSVTMQSEVITFNLHSHLGGLTFDIILIQSSSKNDFTNFEKKSQGSLSLIYWKLWETLWSHENCKVKELCCYWSIITDHIQLKSSLFLFKMGELFTLLSTYGEQQQ